MTLPRVPANYTLLSQQTAALLGGTAGYTVPRKGDTAASALEVDLDGDGTTEMLSFLMKDQIKNAYPCVEIYKSENGAYRLAAQIAGIGDYIDAVYLPVLDSSGARGIVVGWGIDNAAFKGFSVCSYIDGQLATLYSGSYQALFTADMNADGFQEVVFVSGVPAAEGRQAIMLSLAPGGVKATAPVSLSQGLELTRTTVANVGFNRVALLCEGTIPGRGYISDVIICKGGALINLYHADFSQISERTARDIPLWCADANNDGTVELPVPREVPRIENGYFVDWYRCDETTGTDILYTTYHNIEENWYICLPDTLRKNILVESSVATDTVQATLFSYASDEGERGLPLWEIYIFSGEDAAQNAGVLALTPLAYQEEKLYALLIYNLLGTEFYTTRTLPTLFSIIDPQPAVN